MIFKWRCLKALSTETILVGFLFAFMTAAISNVYWQWALEMFLSLSCRVFQAFQPEDTKITARSHICAVLLELFLHAASHQIITSCISTVCVMVSGCCVVVLWLSVKFVRLFMLSAQSVGWVFNSYLFLSLSFLQKLSKTHIKVTIWP